MIRSIRSILTAAAVLAATAAHAQDKGSVNPAPLPPLADTSAAAAAKELFARKPTPAPLDARAIGTYVRGCLAGAVALPVNGKTWQVMRLSRNRNWGHPDLIRFLEGSPRRPRRSRAGRGCWSATSRSHVAARR